MSEEKAGNPTGAATRPVVTPRKAFSIVWVIPLLALALGGWLSVKAYMDKGPAVTITFKTGEDIEAGKTKIRFKDVEIGKVEELTLLPDLSGVKLIARMNPGARKYLTDKTRFWVVRARVTASEVSGLGTLLSGAYIGVDPRSDGQRTNSFVGLESPPPITTDQPGRHFLLKTDDLGSIDIGVPVYYRKIQVGQVVDYHLDDQDDNLIVKVFVESPHDRRVKTDSRFWNASGFDMEVNAEGLKVNTESLVSIMIGGIAFDRPKIADGSSPAEAESQFSLHPDREAAFAPTYSVQERYLAFFDESVRGLVPGSSVEFRGIKIGEVVDVRLQYDVQHGEFRIPVTLDIEPERIEVLGEKALAQEERMQMLIRRGLRGQMKSGNLLTGQMVIAMDFHPRAKSAELTYQDGLPVLPTLPTSVQELAADVGQILDRISQIPFEELGADLKTTINTLNTTLEKTGGLVAGMEQGVVPELETSLKKMQQTLEGIQKSYGNRSAVQLELRRSITELGDAARSIRVLADYLERHPESLIQGKGGQP